MNKIVILDVTEDARHLNLRVAQYFRRNPGVEPVQVSLAQSDQWASIAILVREKKVLKKKALKKKHR